jgi:hypothetical protein
VANTATTTTSTELVLTAIMSTSTVVPCYYYSYE